MSEEEELDQQLRRALEARRELEVEKLRLKMKAVCGPGGAEMKRPKIQVPYSPQQSGSFSLGPRHKKFRSE